jgi:hypothetical protein
MAARANDLRWTGKPGHYEVYYLTLTDPGTGVGVWIRYTMLAPLPSTGAQPSCALWFAAMDPRPGGTLVAHRQTYPIGELRARNDPFELRLAEALLRDGAMTGGLGEASWDLSWQPASEAYQPVKPLLGRLGLARTVFLLPHAHVSIDGWIQIGAERLVLAGVPGGQAHLWGSEHATGWAWAHCSDLRMESGEPAADTFFDGVSALVTRFGRTLGPNTPIVGCFSGRPLTSTSPRRILANSSRFDIDGWSFEAVQGVRRLVGRVWPARDQLVGVTYHDPDGRETYCYNSETASAEIELQRRAGARWKMTERLTSAGRCHFEFGTRTPLADIELLVT